MPADRRKTKSKYAADRNVPGAFEGETVTRRRFMTGTAHTAGAVAASAFALPALGFAIGPIFEKHEQRWQAVGPAGDFPDNTYIPKVITIVDGIGQAGKTTVYLRKRNAQLDTEKAD
ncbi:MAG: (2Fe-2S)-binding protein, partial [Actinomycetota bacterium]|nr:(2Fe-2S)-binding protein [Actinomycetota bacterium]